MKQALEAFKFSNISADEYGSSTRASAEVLYLYIAICYKHLHLQCKLYIYGIHRGYLLFGGEYQIYFIECVVNISIFMSA